MVISGIGTRESFYNSYNATSVNRLHKAESSVVQPVDAVEKAPEVTRQPSVEEIAYARRDQNQTSYDYARKYDATATYNMKGKDSGLESLDIENAISQMQKDQMLQQYRFFVGDSKADEVASSEEAVAEQTARPTENFIL